MKDPQLPFITQLRNGFGGQPRRSAIEIRPRFGEILYWRWAVPVGIPVSEWGYGPAGGGGLTKNFDNHVEGTVELSGRQCSWFGAGNRLTPAVSAYVVFEDRKPEMVYFGVSSEPFGIPDAWYPLRIQ